MRHLQSYTSLPAGGVDESKLSALARKLRLSPDHAVAILNSPPGYLALLDPAPAHVQVAYKPDQTFDAVQLFVNNTDELRALGPGAINATDLPATPWWTKRDVLGEITGVTGYKPVAFVKIDETWTALRFKHEMP